MKNYLPVTFLLISVCSFSQFHLTALNNNVNNVLEKVIEDFPNHFKNIRGSVIDKDVQATNYNCSVNIPGTDSSIIIQNGNDTDNIFSWKEMVFETDDFEKAKQKFHEYFMKIKGTSIKTNNANINFNADYTAPDDAKQFASIIFQAHPETAQFKNVMIDLDMQYVLDGWQINISVYEHKDYGTYKDALN